MYQQSYDPLGNVFLSTLVAAVPILVLLYFIALHRHRDAEGHVHLGISAPYAAFFGVIAAFLVSCMVFRMPVTSAVSAFALGTLSGFLGIIWIVLAAMFLYTMSVVTGKFEIVKESIVHISFDRRLQCVLIAFSFGGDHRGNLRLRDPGGHRRRGDGGLGVQAVSIRSPESSGEHRTGCVGRDRNAHRDACRGQRSGPSDAFRHGRSPAALHLDSGSPSGWSPRS